MFDDHDDERSLGLPGGARGAALREHRAAAVTSLTDHLDEQLRFTTEDSAVRAHRQRDHRQPRRGRLPPRRRGRDRPAVRDHAWRRSRRSWPWCRPSIRPGWRPAPSRSACSSSSRPIPNPDPVSVEIVEEHFDELSRRRYPDIARALKLSLDRIMESVEEIMGLEPKPGRRFGGNDSRYIVPDVVVHKMGDEYVVVLNEDGVPRLRVNSLYRSLLRTAGSEAREYVEQKLRSAVWLIKSVDQRQRTLRKVTQIDREVPARVPRQGAAVPAPAVAARRGRGHRHARVHHQPRHDQQVRGDAAGPLRAEVLLPQRHRLRATARWSRRCR